MKWILEVMRWACLVGMTLASHPAAAQTQFRNAFAADAPRLQRVDFEGDGPASTAPARLTVRSLHEEHAWLTDNRPGVGDIVRPVILALVGTGLIVLGGVLYPSLTNSSSGSSSLGLAIDVALIVGGVVLVGGCVYKLVRRLQDRDAYQQRMDEIDVELDKRFDASAPQPPPAPASAPAPIPLPPPSSPPETVPVPL